MSYRLSASRMMKAREVLQQGKLLSSHSAILVALELKVKHHFSHNKK